MAATAASLAAVVQREEDPVTVFMGVPTMYNYLLSAYDEMSTEEQRRAARAASRLRLTVSGSAACPVPIMDRWEQLSGATSPDAAAGTHWQPRRGGEQGSLRGTSRCLVCQDHCKHSSHVRAVAVLSIASGLQGRGCWSGTA